MVLRGECDYVGRATSLGVSAETPASFPELGPGSLPVRHTPAIRSAEPTDSSALTRVAREAKASWGYPADWLREWEETLSFPPDYILRHTVLMAELEGRVVGVGALEETPNGLEVGHLWVLPEAQGHGVGRALLERMVELARERGARSLRIESDPNARAFYERFGAVLVGESAAPVGGTARMLPVLELPI